MNKSHRGKNRSQNRGRQSSPKPQPNASSLISFPRPQNGRLLAWSTLQKYDETEQFLADILAAADPWHQLPSQERGLAVDITSGVLRRRRTIDTLLESQISRPRVNVEPDLWRLLQMGVYQLLFARTPEHAAVDATVEIARMVNCSRWCGFANGVLRNIGRLVTDDVTQQPAADALPIEAGVYRKLTSPVFPDPDADAADYFGQAYSLPRSLARRWSARMSHFDLLKAAFHGLAIPRTVLRINRLKATVGQVQEALESAGVESGPGNKDWTLILDHAARLTSLPGFVEGWWSVQDESAMFAAELIDPQPDERILDLCAAPGGKSTHLAELSEDRATIIACDVSESRLQKIEDSVARLQLSSVQPELIERDGSDLPPGPYDAILVDVPCSNTGVLARRPEARWRFRENELEELVQLQTRLLLTAFDNVRPGGRIVYSTCSIEPEETSVLMQSLTTAVAGLTLKKQQLQLPGQPGDGAFQALLIRED